MDSFALVLILVATGALLLPFTLVGIYTSVTEIHYWWVTRGISWRAFLWPFLVAYHVVMSFFERRARR